MIFPTFILVIILALTQPLVASADKFGDNRGKNDDSCVTYTWVDPYPWDFLGWFGYFVTTPCAVTTTTTTSSVKTSSSSTSTASPTTTTVSAFGGAPGQNKVASTTSSSATTSTSSSVKSSSSTSSTTVTSATASTTSTKASSSSSSSTSTSTTTSSTTSTSSAASSSTSAKAFGGVGQQNNIATTTTAAAATGSAVSAQKRKREIEANVSPSSFRCETGFIGCQKLGAPKGTWECIPDNRVDSCGGCPFTAAVVDCSEIAGVDEVSCQIGKCSIKSCGRGYIYLGGNCIPSLTGSKARRRFSDQSRRAASARRKNERR